MKPVTQVNHKAPRAGEVHLSAGEARILDSLDDRGPQNLKALVATTGLNEEQAKRAVEKLLAASRIAIKMTRAGRVYEKFIA